MKKQIYAIFCAAALLASTSASADLDSDVLNAFMRHTNATQTVGIDKTRLSRQLEVAANDPTLSLLMAVRNWDDIRPETRETLSKYLNVSGWENGERTINATTSFDSCETSVPEDSNQTMDSTHFRVVYTTGSTSNHKTTTDFVTALLTEMEKSWTKEVTEMGFPAPKLPSDGKLRIYVCNLLGNADGLLGRTWTTTVNSGDNTASTFVELDNDYAEMSLSSSEATDYAGLVFAHEFFHAIQFGINYAAPSYWLLESNATWVEDEVYPESNDYITQYVRGRLAVLDKSIDYFSFNDVYGYGASIFFRHITENEADVAFMPAMWSNLKTTCALSETSPQWKTWCKENITETPLIESTLATYGKNIQDTYRDFNIANYTKDYIDGGLSNFPTITPSSISMANDSASVSGELDHLAAKFYKLNYSISSSSAPPVITFTGSASADWRLTFVLETESGQKTIENETPENGNYSGTLDTLGVTHDSVTIIVNNAHLTTDDASFSMDISAPPYSHTFEPGWNLVGIPFQPSLSTAQSTFKFEDISTYQLKNGVYYYDGEQDIIAPGGCYWMYFDEETTIASSGAASTTNVVNLKKGWNLISIPYDEAVAWDEKIMVSSGSTTASITSAEGEALINNGIFVYGENAEPSGYEGPIEPDGSFTIEPWKGFAVSALQDCQLIFPSLSSQN